MDILYVVGDGSKWDNNELRYSLRSIEKNGRNIDRVFLVGEKPNFLNEDTVTYIYCYDKYGAGHKHNNIHYKVRYAISTGKLSDHFLIMSDDQYYIQETDFDNYPVYYKNIHIPYEMPFGIKPGEYWYSMFETRKYLLKNGLPTYQTNPHCAKHIDVKLWEKYNELLENGFELPHGAEINLLMGNLMIANGVEPQPITDCKVFRYNTPQQLELKIADKHVFSIADSSLECGMRGVLSRMFPEKSKFEL